MLLSRQSARQNAPRHGGAPCNSGFPPRNKFASQTDRHTSQSTARCAVLRWCRCRFRKSFYRAFHSVIARSILRPKGEGCDEAICSRRKKIASSNFLRFAQKILLAMTEKNGVHPF